ncbi:GTP-binding protein [Agrobacterium sp. SORGH_AS 787]|uniref:CobW family GTP-binding protein n=1 Tax=Agrobacterium sp. SORGH_AS 787 TaxID=3041775 RepID=UPI00278B444D|nr:G3E family GTPase [Rhizobium sp. SORGH_AS_0787]
MTVDYIPAEPTPVLLVTGFLGSGKTTLINHLLRQPDLARTAVIINEFGEIGLDHELVEASSENMVLLQSGCLCCTIRSDLLTTLHVLVDRRDRGEIAPFNRIVIETTGLADPAPILHTLIIDGFLGEAFRLDGVIATVDAAAGGATLDAQPEAVKQAAMADRILLTKTDIAGRHAVREIEERLRKLNPGTPIIRTYQGAVEPSRLFNVGLYFGNKIDDVQAWLNAEAYEEPSQQHAHQQRDHHHHHHHGHGEHHHHHHVNRHDERISAVSYTVNDPIPADIFDLWLETLVLLSGPNILRLKGIVNVEGIPAPFVLHGVQHIFHPPTPLHDWPREDRRTRIVLIGRDRPMSFFETALPSWAPRHAMVTVLMITTTTTMTIIMNARK